MNGNTALHHAARNVHVRLVQLLCQRGADVSIRNKQGIQARGVKPWDGKRGWNTTPERWSQETKDAVRDIKNALQEAFNKQRLKKEIEQREAIEEKESRDRQERIKRRVDQAKEKEGNELSSNDHVSLIPQRIPSSPPDGSIGSGNGRVPLSPQRNGAEKIAGPGDSVGTQEEIKNNIVIPT